MGQRAAWPALDGDGAGMPADRRQQGSATTLGAGVGARWRVRPVCRLLRRLVEVIDVVDIADNVTYRLSSGACEAARDVIDGRTATSHKATNEGPSLF